jgi:hypothetical protein
MYNRDIGDGVCWRSAWCVMASKGVESGVVRTAVVVRDALLQLDPRRHSVAHALTRCEGTLCNRRKSGGSAASTDADAAAAATAAAAAASAAAGLSACQVAVSDHPSKSQSKLVGTQVYFVGNRRCAN